MKKLELIATATFGLEAVVKREIENLGYKITKSEDGKVTFLGDTQAIAKCNLWLRCADRVLLKMGEFSALSFEELFEQTKKIPWEEWIPQDGKFTVTGTSVKSKLFSVSDCQAIVKKSIVERLKSKYQCDWFEETGAEYTVKISILKDTVTLTIDTSGVGLHKRGYRINDVEAPIKETLAAAMVSLSFYRHDRVLVDPFCGSGTIPIEAAMYERNIAPGLNRTFASETWDNVPPQIWKTARREAYEAIKHDLPLKIFASDINKRAVAFAKENAAEAGVEDCIIFDDLPVSSIYAPEEYGIIICNPPYGERIGSKEEIDGIYKDLIHFYKKNPSWSLYLITSDKDFERTFSKKPADRRRKLYNGRLEVTYYQYYGPRPPKKDAPKED